MQRNSHSSFCSENPKCIWQELINIPSFYNESNNKDMPFGESVNNALKYMLNLGEYLGFKTKNIDGLWIHRVW